MRRQISMKDYQRERVARRLAMVSTSSSSQKKKANRRMGSFFSWALSFVYKSPDEYLKDAELQILQNFSNTSCQSQFIPISNRAEIRTLRFDVGFARNAPVLVLLHGLCSGLGVWSPCFDLLSQHCIVYAIDLPGFGRSTRTHFLGDRDDIEYQFVSYLEEWRDAVGIDSFVIAGHGFGGYIALLYAIRYPEAVKHLILVEPWGFTEMPFGIAGKASRSADEGATTVNYEDGIPFWMKFFNFIINIISPFVVLRCLPRAVATWLWQKILETTTPVLSTTNKYKHSLTNYIYNCNSLSASGEYAFLRLNLMYFWAKQPIIQRMKLLDDNVPISFIYGSRSSVDHKTGFEVFHYRPASIVEVYMIPNAGHNVFMDCPERFCDIVLNVIEDETQKDMSLSIVGSGSEVGTEDLYWDCAWETINLSTANLNFVEGAVQEPLGNNWEDFKMNEEGDDVDEWHDDESIHSEEDIFYNFD